MQIFILKESVSGPADHWRKYVAGETANVSDEIGVEMIHAGLASPARDDEPKSKRKRGERAVFYKRGVEIR